MFNIEDCLPISGLQHLAFCKRQWALIHLDQEWEENQFTAEGRNLHERVDEGYQEFRRGLRQYSGLYVRSLAFGIYGRTDLVEAIQTSGPDCQIGLLGLKGNWVLYPVEFKRGKPKDHSSDLIQLCAQALCLEEMTGTKIPEGAIFYGQIRKRLEVSFDANLRKTTHDFISLAHEMIVSGKLPEPEYGKHCRVCSLFEVCLPRSCENGRIDGYRKELLG